MKLLQLLSLLAALVSVGMMAGLFTGFSYAVMPGIKILDDKAWVAAMQQINKVIINGWFMPAFLGAVVFTGAATALIWASSNRAALPWVIVALVLSLVMFIGTMAVNVPLNDEIMAVGDPSQATDLAALRERVEAKWIAWNTVRGVASVGSLLALGWALFAHGRAAG